ncbi:MAG: DUF4362 domain-containing protein [Ruminococcaceae bacterium]|nr:DUF4362 domain-containing protein [Oscillospiraceae bacterium]
MTRILILFAALSLLCACGRSAEPQTTPSKLTGTAVITTQSESELTASSVTLRTQYPVYDKSCTYISLLIENNSVENVEFGTEWMLEKKIGDEWRQVEFMDNLGWTQPLFTVMPEGYYLHTCSLEIFKDSLTDGEYRIVKELSDRWYGAEFTIGDSPITAQSPHGFVPLEDLPHDYSREDAISDGVVVCGFDGIKNPEKIGEFFRFANDRNFKGQLRIARFTVEGDMILTDVVRRLPDRIDVQTDTTRDRFGGGEISTEYYSYFTVNGDNICLSNTVEHDNDSARELFSPECVAAEDHDTVAAYYKNPYGNYPSISVWSPDGEIRATAQDGGELSFGTTGWGTMWSLRGDVIKEHPDIKVSDIVWENNGIVMIMAELPDGTCYYEFIRVDKESMNSIETVSYTFSQYKYTRTDEGIIIPE